MNNSSVDTEGCLSKTNGIAFGGTLFFLSTLANIFFIVIVYYSNSTTNLAFRNQAYLLINVASSNIFYSVILLHLFIFGGFLQLNSDYCTLLKEAAGFAINAGYSCAFINHVFLTLNRYISCKFPLKYSLIVTRKRVLFTIACSWAVSFISNAFGFLEDVIHLEKILIPLRKSSVIIFSFFYFSCSLLVLFLNVRLWLMGYLLYRRDVVVSCAGAENLHQIELRRNRLKATFISFILTIKNITIFLPYAVVLQLRAYNNCVSDPCEVLHAVAGPMTSVSFFLDPFIYLLVIKEARQFVKKKLCRRTSVVLPTSSTDNEPVIRVVRR